MLTSDAHETNIGGAAQQPGELRVSLASWHAGGQDEAGMLAPV